MSQVTSVGVSGWGSERRPVGLGVMGIDSSEYYARKPRSCGSRRCSLKSSGAS